MARPTCRPAMARGADSIEGVVAPGFGYYEEQPPFASLVQLPSEAVLILRESKSHFLKKTSISRAVIIVSASRRRNAPKLGHIHQRSMRY
jgi:hypothetical protein